MNELSDGDGFTDANTHSYSLVLFWLYALYSTGITGGNSIQQPLRREIKTICKASNGMSFVALVDDANVFDIDKSHPSSFEIEEIVAKNSDPSFGKIGSIIYFWKFGSICKR